MGSLKNEESVSNRILYEEMVALTGENRSDYFFRTRISKKSWEKWRSNLLRNSERTKRKLKKDKTAKLRKSLQEKRKAKKQRVEL